MKTALTFEPPRFVVVHPLDDFPEEKFDPELLGPMVLGRSMKLSLMALRGYLFVMSFLVIYHVAAMAGVL